MAPKAKRRALREERSNTEARHNEEGAVQPEPQRAVKRATTTGAQHRLVPDVAAQTQFADRIAEAAESLAADVCLVACDGSRHPAHRLVLCARSPFFLKMLSSGMREQATGEVHLPDVEPERLSAVLSWMYGKGAVVDLSCPSVALSLLELAKRWEVSELCEQLSSCEACALAEANVLGIWEAARRLSLGKLEGRCREFVMGLLASLLRSDVIDADCSNGPGGVPSSPRLCGSPTSQRRGLPTWLRSLTPGQFSALVECDELPVYNEEEALSLVLAYVTERGLPCAAETAELDEVLLAIRWRLIPGPVIAERAMRHPALLDADGSKLRPCLLAAVADGMQFQFLGGKAWAMLPPSPASRLRVHHRIPVRGYGGLAPGMAVRVLSDVEQLRHLCRRCAPGARLKVEWVAEMRSLAGATCRVKELREEISGAQLEDPLERGVDRYLPFDALLLA